MKIRGSTSIFILLGIIDYSLGFNTNIAKFHAKRNEFQIALSMAKKEDLPLISSQLNEAMKKCQPEFIKTCKVEVGVSPNGNRLGLIATDKMKKGDVALAIPYDDQIILTPELALDVYNGVLPTKYDGWTGDNGLLALLLLNEVAKTATNGSAGIAKPTRKADAANLISAWIKALPSPQEMKENNMHPFLYSEDDQETLQASSTKKVYRLLDDLEEDAAWLEERVWEADRQKFPASAELNGETYPCFNLEGFTWASALVASRSVFVDGSSRLIPVMDMANHDDIGANEVVGGTMGTFGTTKGAVVKTANGKTYEKGSEFLASYGPKSAAEYLLEHGFLPKASRSMQTSVAELTFEIDEEDRFRDDKLDILEFETYDNAPMEPVQSFDVLGTKDAFLLESVFRRDIWEFMSLPVSEPNERAVLETIASSCSKALAGMEGIEAPEDEDENSPQSLCAIVRESETKALSRTLEYVEREKEALDLKEYYQERRLKDLGLDSEWNPDESGSALGDDYDDDLSFGQTRAPGSLDW
ncbi:large subunit of ribulose-1,5-bisphosphate carboxylase [Chaetoceros tenuissimus]|uniref:Large subunit of ribulose-1,5-bisphosphate carboxylase n=1 Tax=Chaetoceros tenuissimus TaxID=426638 RepID=A0AAD3DAL8_9STRA|nr:large subunit of ribulose-1,5-bisphosphate carboxylase [Chaetoceros tenuissimus]